MQGPEHAAAEEPVVLPRAAGSELLALPWETPLAEWSLARSRCGTSLSAPSRHLVKFAGPQDVGGAAHGASTGAAGRAAVPQTSARTSPPGPCGGTACPVGKRQLRSANEPTSSSPTPSATAERSINRSRAERHARSTATMSPSPARSTGRSGSCSRCRACIRQPIRPSSPRATSGRSQSSATSYSSGTRCPLASPAVSRTATPFNRRTAERA
jgi:hypothetical protein